MRSPRGSGRRMKSARWKPNGGSGLWSSLNLRHFSIPEASAIDEGVACQRLGASSKRSPVSVKWLGAGGFRATYPSREFA